MPARLEIEAPIAEFPRVAAVELLHEPDSGGFEAYRLGWLGYMDNPAYYDGRDVVYGKRVLWEDSESKLLPVYVTEFFDAEVVVSREQIEIAMKEGKIENFDEDVIALIRTRTGRVLPMYDGDIISTQEEREEQYKHWRKDKTYKYWRERRGLT